MKDLVSPRETAILERLVNRENPTQSPKNKVIQFAKETLMPDPLNRYEDVLTNQRAAGIAATTIQTAANIINAMPHDPRGSLETIAGNLLINKGALFISNAAIVGLGHWATEQSRRENMTMQYGQEYDHHKQKRDEMLTRRGITGKIPNTDIAKDQMFELMQRTAWNNIGQNIINNIK